MSTLDAFKELDRLIASLSGDVKAAADALRAANDRIDGLQRERDTLQSELTKMREERRALAAFGYLPKGAQA